MENKFVSITGGLIRDKVEIKKIIEEYTGAKLFGGKIGSTITLLVATQKEVEEKRLKKVIDAAKFGTITTSHKRARVRNSLSNESKFD